MARKNKRVAKNEFRYNRNQKHITFVFEDDGKRYTAVGITHQPESFGKKNMPLEHNPQKFKQKGDSFVRNGFIRDRHSSYGRPNNNYALSSEDYPKVKAKIRNYKKKRKKNK